MPSLDDPGKKFPFSFMECVDTTNKRLNVNVVAQTGGAAGTQYQADTTTASATGTLILGYDGTVIRQVTVDASGDLQIDVKGALPAGTNNIGDVDVLTLPAGTVAGSSSLPAGTNNIGDVDILSIAAGDNNIGNVDIASIAAGDNNIGNVDLASSIPAGTNNIGDVDVLTQPARSRSVDSISSALATDALMNGTTALTPKFVAISVSASGATELVASASSSKTRVLGYNLMAAGTVNVKFQGGATDLTGLSYFVANTGKVAPISQYGWFQGGTGSAIKINLSANIAVGGELVYVELG